MKKKLLAILLSTVMIVGLLPVTALAEDPTVYDIWVDGIQVTSENKDNLCNGTVSYDPTTHTLSLNNATLDNDTMSDYGIKTIIPNTLKIRLTGTNSITRTCPGGGMGIAPNSNNSVEITGEGTLVINVNGENYDGISAGADVRISDKAKVRINSEGGLGIVGRMVEIDGATVDSTGLYAGIDAHGLKIVNGADVTLKATQNERNGAFIWKDQEGNGGDIELAASKVKVTSYYPGLYAAGNLTINGGEVSCTSTADSAIWTKGDILIKGGAKVTTDGKYPMGGNGSFTVEEAEIDAKNTNVNNIPAIFDESVPVIADGYKLTYAKAVDSEETEIDLLSSGTQYFALYKNVHFITKTAYPVTFVVTPGGLTNVVVKVNNQPVSGSVSLTAGTHSVEVTADNCEVYSGNVTITADTATHTQNIAMTYLPADYTKVDEALAKANALNKDDYKDFSAVEAAVNAVVRDKNITEQATVDAMAKAIEDAIAALQYKDADYTKVDEAIAKANALNKDDYKDFSAVEAAVNAVVRDKNITEQATVDAMAKAIEDAIAALQYKDADYTKVDEAIAKANALNKDDYKDFSAVEAAVNAVVRDKNITEQATVDAMAKAIEDAIAALQYKDADYTKVDEAIAKANALNKDEYKNFSAVQASIDAVVRDKNITEQATVDAMAKAIEDAIDALEYKDADYTKVDEAIAKANALNKDQHKNFSAVEAAVNAVVRDKNITEQTEVDAMANAIEDAINALEKKPAEIKPEPGNKSPKTGDNSNLMLWIVLLFISGGAVIGTAVTEKKKKQK